MKTLQLAFFTGLLALGPAWLQAAVPTVTLADGETVTMTGVRKETVTAQGGQFANLDGNYVYSTGDATIKIEYPSDTARGGLWCGVLVTSGTLTLDLTALGANDYFRLDNGLVTTGGGRVVVKGRDFVHLGGGNFTASGNNFSPPADCPNLSFVDGTGAAYAAPRGLVLCERFLEVNLPTSVPWSVEPNSTASVYRAESPIVASLLGNGKLTIDTYDLWMLRTNAVPADAVIEVGSGREFTVIPRGVTVGTPQDSAYYSQSGDGTSACVNDIVLAGGSLNLRNHYSLYMRGAVSGTGRLRATATKEDVRAGGTYMNGACSFAGAVSVETISVPLVFSQALPGAAGNSVSLVANGRLQLGAAGDGVASIASVAGPAAGTPALVTFGAGAFEIGSRSGLVTFAGAGFDRSRVAVGRFAAGESLTNDCSATVCCTVTPALAADPDLVALMRTDDCNLYYMSGSDETVDIGALNLLPGAEYALAAVNGKHYANIPPSVRFSVGNGVSARLYWLSPDETNSAHVAEGGSLAFGEGFVWRRKLRYAMDPSDVATVTTNGTRALSGVTYPVVEGVGDASASGDLRLGYYSETMSTWPTLITNGCAGRAYLACDNGGNRRLWFGKNTNLVSKFCVMVFGSQYGGGQGVLGNTGGYYRRGGTLNQSITKDAPIFANGEISTWVNGVKVNPSETGLSGGWQILSVDTSGEAIQGLGFNGNIGTSSNARGQAYGETLFFGETLTETERRSVERYLAERWGVADYPSSSERPTIRLSGKGVVRLESDAAIAGSFAGTVDLNGHQAVFADLPLPPGEEAVPAAGRVGWYDPMATDRLVLSEAQDVGQFYSRDTADTSVAGTKYLNAAGRPPRLRTEARGEGPVRNWIFYSPYVQRGPTSKSAGVGNALRFNEVGQTEPSRTEKPVSCKTVVMVQDSSESGGTPFLDNRSGAVLFGCRFAMRSDEHENPEPLASAPIWAGNSVGTMATGRTYLDGVEVDGSRVGFNGRPEVFVAMRDEAFSVGYFADLYYQNNVTNLVSAGEIQGEILLYDTVLSESERIALDAYLAWKWLGVARPGYASAARLTLTGGGAVGGVKAGDLPSFSAGFTGSAALVDADYAFSVAKDGTVSGKIVATGATLSFPAACTATVSFAQGVRAGEYVLVDAQAIEAGTTWSLVVTGIDARRVALTVRDGRLILTVAPNGMVLVVK